MAATTSSLIRASTVLQLLFISATIWLTTAAPTVAPTVPMATNGDIALGQFKGGMEVLQRVHEGKLFSVLHSEEDMSSPVESGAVTMERLNEALNVTCKLRKAKDNVWALVAITGEQPDADFRLLHYITSVLIETSCKWTKSILTDLFPSSAPHLQCTSDEIDRMCDEYDFLNKAKRVISNLGIYKPDISGQADWMQAHVQSDSPLLVRYNQYVEYEPARLNATYF